ncbi:DeoR/GlpR family DNA-binding transcription regulator [Paenibacillus oryzisoli]|uniref:DeoR/GlpR family DNA-binding transcription regulator n=1 Tax=Paenibacillus oryzisoli TaxID=1850517 RepID=UPI003D2D24D8
MQVMLNARQQQIKERLELLGEVKIGEMKDFFGVTEMTIRRDLEKLEQIGLLRRTFGGAIMIGKDVALKDRADLWTEEKSRIGRRAADLIQAGDSVFIDGGTTTVQIVRALKPRSNITVVTNALNVASELISKKISTIVIGGTMLETTSTMVGPIAAATISSMSFDRIFLGATGITSKHGYSNSNMYEAEIKKLAIRQATEVNIVVDQTKFGAKMLASFGELSKADRIITDRLPESELMTACREASVELLES